MSNKTVAVTGATGYLATEIINQLFAKGYDVYGTVRSTKSEAATLLSNLFPKLKLFEADLLKEDSFDEVLAGVNYVIHTASPFPQKIVDAHKEVLEPALAGTKNVLASVSKNPNIKRVVVTGSCAAVVEHVPKDDGTKVWTEEDWNTTSTPSEGPYRLSKVLAEKYVYEWAEKHPEVTVSTILPTFILGPPLTKRADATSIKVIQDLLNGTTKAAGGTPANSVGAVDVRDVARAHIAALEKPNATGRYIVSSERGIPRIEYCRILKKTFPDWPLPENEIGKAEYKAGNVINGKYSIQKAAKELDITLTPLETTLTDMAQKMIELGIVTKPK